MSIRMTQRKCKNKYIRVRGAKDGVMTLVSSERNARQQEPIHIPHTPTCELKEDLRLNAMVRIRKDGPKREAPRLNGKIKRRQGKWKSPADGVV